MKKAKKVLLLVLCAVLLISATAAGTVAYLTDQDNVVTNTFTVGKVVITMDESLVDAYGKKYLKKSESEEEGDEPTYTEVEAANADRVTANQYKLVPGHEYIKDPTIHVDAESEPCYLFVKIDNQIGATLTGQTNWTNIKDDDNNPTNYWKYSNIVNPGANVLVFTSFTYSSNVTDTTADAAKHIEVTAYAIQSDGFDSVDAAWAALHPTNTTNN